MLGRDHSQDEKVDGLNSHLMIITPSQETFDEIITRAKQGEYIPFTNTEQDVLEALWMPRLFGTTQVFFFDR